MRRNFWSCKSWYSLNGGVFDFEKVKLSDGGTTLEIKCRGYDGKFRQGYYKNGNWVETGNG